MTRILVPYLLLASLCLAGDAPDRFDLELLARLAGDGDNVVCSPLSVRIALAMTLEGARGTTAEEMARVLHLDEEVRADLDRLRAGLEVRGEHLEISTANALWPWADAGLLPEYLDLLKRRYGAAPEVLDFAAQPREAARRINAWVSERTRERIREIVTADAFTPNTTLVLTNALYFRGAWEEPFPERGTMPRPFFRGSIDDKYAVPTMARTDTFRYAEAEGLKAVELPYAGGRFAMVVLVPLRSDAPGGRRLDLAGPGAGPIDAARLGAVLAALQPEQVQVFLPRFRFESAFGLGKVLEAMGMPTAFSAHADFSGMNGKTDLYISLVLHRAFVAADEKGTEAAAATAVVMERKGEPKEPKAFHADRPFLFCIRDRETGAILFAGRVCDPRK